MYKKLNIGFCLLLLGSAIVNAGVSGTVYKDLPLNGSSINTYGIKDSNEKGLEGITVTAYPSAVSTTTDTNGSWSLATSGKVKIEFTSLPSYLKESAGESSVQFIDGDASNVDLALYSPSEYTNDQSHIAMTLQPAANLNSPDTNLSLKILAKDEIPSDQDATPPSANTGDVPFSKMGTVWGLAYDTLNETIYTAAVLRRHGAIGPEGTGAIYKVDSNGNVEHFITVANTGTVADNDSRDIDTQPSHDPVFDEVGRVGLGDLDISTDGKKLYTINLNTNALIEINISTKTQSSYDIGSPFGVGCSDVRSWGIGHNSGKIYVGSVCTTDTTQGAYISEFDGSTFTPFHQIPLDMKGENSLDTHYALAKKLLPNDDRWGNWITTPTSLFDGSGTRASLAAAILSDIVFDENNEILLGFIDRTALQAGVLNFSPVSTDSRTYKYDSAGDMYKVCKTSTGYVNEGQAGCEQHDQSADSTEHVYPEFFVGEEWSNARHKETALGGLAYIHGSNTLLSSAFDPTDIDAILYDTSGLIWMNTTSGEKTAAKRIVGFNEDIAYNGKSGSIGDIEILTAAAPTEIGNRVWIDTNENCVQDANESGIANVEVSLYASSSCTGVANSRVTTDANGTYLFSVTPNTVYSICINNISEQSVLSDRNITCTTGGTSINNNDATLVGNDAKISVAALNTGANDHSLDFGFTSRLSDNQGSEESSVPALSIFNMMLLISLTFFIVFLFKKELK